MPPRTRTTSRQTDSLGVIRLPSPRRSAIAWSLEAVDEAEVDGVTEAEVGAAVGAEVRVMVE